MPQTQAAGTGCLLRALRAYAVFAIACGTVAVSAGYCASGRAVRRAEAAWAEAGAPMDAFIARFPLQADSPAALKLDELTRPLGIPMAGVTPKATPESKAQGERLQAVGKALTACERSGSDRCPPFPADTASLLQAEAARLDAIETHILDGGPLLWEQDVAKGLAAPIPHLLGHRYLQNLLLGRASLRIAEGTPQLAEKPLEASWILNASLAGRPDLISRLIVTAIGGMERGVLRTLPKPRDPWPSRLHQPLFPQPLRVPFQLEAWNWTRFTTGSWGLFDLSSMEDGVAPRSSALGAVGRWLTAPYVRLSFAGMSEALLAESQRLDAERRCDLDVDRHAKEFEASFPRWNILGRIATPSLVRSWAALRRAELDQELTTLVLAARGARAASGQWPTVAVPSAVCEGVSFEQSAGADGTLTIRTDSMPFPHDAADGRWSIQLHP